MEWLMQAACAQPGAAPDLWFEHPQAAIHVCTRHCPVLDECAKDAQRRPPSGGVQAGVLWTGDVYPQPVSYRPGPLGHGDWCALYRARELVTVRCGASQQISLKSVRKRVACSERQGRLP